MGKLLLHIGSEKAGSTSLQSYLNLMSKFDLPFNYVTGSEHLHSYYDYSLASELALKDFSASELNSSFDYGTLDDRIKKIKDDPLPSILSCELFYRNPNALRVILSCCKKHSVNVFILALVRSFQKYCRSLYGEAIKWGEAESPLKWAKRTRKSLLSMEALSVCADFFPGKTCLWNFDRLTNEVDWVDPILFLLEESLVSCFEINRFSRDQISLLTLDRPENQGLDVRLLSVLREANRSFSDPRVTRSLLPFLSSNPTIQKALVSSSDQGDPAGHSFGMQRELKRLDRFTQTVENLHAHHLAFSGTNSLKIYF